MTTGIIITLCILLLISYVFDLTSAKTKIPSVILLLLLGWVLKQGTIYFSIPVPNLAFALPVLGTIGLILIVLEGALELELNRKKLSLIRKSIISAIIPLGLLAFGFAYLFQSVNHNSFRHNLVNAIPLCVISSAIAIPSARSLMKEHREFVIYESSFSDILGVLFFNFVALNDEIGAHSFGQFSLQVLLIIAISFIATLALAFLLHKIDHHIKFVPITLLVILIYAVSKIYHLPGLIFILVFGLFLGNLDELKRFKWVRYFNPEELDKEAKKFKGITIEATFLIRSLFFLLFGYLINMDELLDASTLLWSCGLTLVIFVLRAILLKIFRLPVQPLLFIAPRGLITILLFLSILPSQRIELMNNSLIIQVIILTALIMMVGSIISKKNPTEPVQPNLPAENKSEDLIN